MARLSDQRHGAGVATEISATDGKERSATEGTEFTEIFLELNFLRVLRVLRGYVRLRALRVLRGYVVFVAFASSVAIVAPATAQEPLPALVAPVNDFASVLDPTTERRLDAVIRALHQASGDVVVVTTVDTFAPYGDIREYAVKMFENGGRGIGERGKDNGLLVVLAVNDRQVWVEVGYDLEEFVTDGFAGEVSRNAMVPEFRRGNYGAGLLAGVTGIAQRIADRRNVTLEGVPAAGRTTAPQVGPGGAVLLAIFVIFMVVNAIAARLGGGRGNLSRRWGGHRRGWSSGVGPFGGGFGGGFGSGGGFGGGFGGFGGGRSGGGGGGGGW
jgi:uncharacterized protein